MSDSSLTTTSQPPKELEDYFARLLLGTPISVLDNGQIKTYYLLDKEMKQLEKLRKDL